MVAVGDVVSAAAINAGFSLELAVVIGAFFGGGRRSAGGRGWGARLDHCPGFSSVAGPVVKLQQRTPRRRGQQPKLLNSPEDSLYYNQLNVSSKCR